MSFVAMASREAAGRLQRGASQFNHHDTECYRDDETLTKRSTFDVAEQDFFVSSGWLRDCTIVGPEDSWARNIVSVPDSRKYVW
jgi:hypothetical protein